LIGQLVASGKLTPEGLVELMSKGFVDPGSLFSKFMAAAALFWLKPDSARSGGRRSSPATERTFDLLWLAYEKWVNRGVAHLSQAAGLWTTFYGNIRWTLVRKRDDENFEMDKYIAAAGQEWLIEVHKLTAKNFRELHREIKGVLEELEKISGVKKELLPITDLVKDDDR
jgi:hypothetical protein